MSEVRLVIRDRERSISGNCHGASAERVVAALSAEPETIAELETAIRRYERSSNERSFFAHFLSGDDCRPWDAGLVIIDLAARLIASDNTYFTPTPNGYVGYHDGQCETEVGLHYRLPEDWLLRCDALAWEHDAQRRRDERRAQPPLDARAVLFGLPLLEFIAEQCFEAFAEHAVLPTEDETTDGEKDAVRYEHACRQAISDIHARWLLTARDDLRGRSPREVMMATHRFIQLDLQDRCHQWSLLCEPPRPIDVGAHAYRYAHFGTHEMVMYYYTVRELLWTCHDMLAAETAPALTCGDFLAMAVPALAACRDAWLDRPDPEYSGRTPRAIIEREWRRLPQVMEEHDHLPDDDCPLCQMMKDDRFGPTFWHIDGCNMDWEFAFSFHATREEWDAEQRDYEEFSRYLDAKEAARKELGAAYPGEGYAHPDSVWQRSFVAQDAGADLPLPLRLFSVGARLAELIVDLRDADDDGALVDRLKQSFANLSECLAADDPAYASALLEPVLERFRAALADTGAARPALAAKCDDLSGMLERFLEVPREAPPCFSDDWPDADEEGDVPF